MIPIYLLTFFGVMVFGKDVGICGSVFLYFFNKYIFINFTITTNTFANHQLRY